MVTRRERLPAYAAAAWGILFAIPSFYWALGGRAGVRSTISPALVKLVEDGDTGFIAVLWTTGVLKVVGALLGWALARSWGPRIRLVLLWAGSGGGVLLVWHGLLFIVQGALIQAGIIDIETDLIPVSRWYTYLWGPWFLAGGIAFAAASRLHLRRYADRRAGSVALAIGGLGALTLSAGATLAGLG